MGITYSVTYNTGISNTTINTEDTFLELSAVLLRVKRVRVRMMGTSATVLTTAGLDNDWKVRLVRKTAGGATGTAGTAVRLNQAGRTSGATVTIKNTTSAFSTATLGDIIDSAVCNGRAIYEWIARDEEEMIVTHPTLASGGMFAILIQSAVASQSFIVTCDWEEL